MNKASTITAPRQSGPMGFRMRGRRLAWAALLALGAFLNAEATGLILGRDFDLAAKEAIPFLHRFRKGIIVFHEDVGRAGAFLARAVIAAIERRAPEQGQLLETPTDPKSD